MPLQRSSVASWCRAAVRRSKTKGLVPKRRSWCIWTKAIALANDFDDSDGNRAAFYEAQDEASGCRGRMAIGVSGNMRRARGRRPECLQGRPARCYRMPVACSQPPASDGAWHARPSGPRRQPCGRCRARAELAATDAASRSGGMETGLARPYDAQQTRKSSNDATVAS